jgi:hypothetical protein
MILLPFLFIIACRVRKTDRDLQHYVPHSTIPCPTGLPIAQGVDAPTAYGGLTRFSGGIQINVLMGETRILISPILWHEFELSYPNSGDRLGKRRWQQQPLPGWMFVLAYDAGG